MTIPRELSEAEVEEIRVAVGSGIKAFVADFVERAIENLFRCRSLVELPDLWEKVDGRPMWAGDEVLRAAVVMMHATIEDVLRTVAMGNLPFETAETTRHPRFREALRDLRRGNPLPADFHEKLVQSIRDSLGRQTYNNATEVRKIVQRVGVSEGEFGDELLTSIDGLMSRRHDIVHRADRRSDGQIKTISIDKVREWLTDCESFVRIFSTTAARTIVMRRVIERVELVRLLENDESSVGQPSLPSE